MISSHKVKPGITTQEENILATTDDIGPVQITDDEILVLQQEVVEVIVHYRLSCLGAPKVYDDWSILTLRYIDLSNLALWIEYIGLGPSCAQHTTWLQNARDVLQDARDALEGRANH